MDKMVYPDGSVGTPGPGFSAEGLLAEWEAEQATHDEDNNPIPLPPAPFTIVAEEDIPANAAVIARLAAEAALPAGIIMEDLKTALEVELPGIIAAAQIIAEARKAAE